MRWRPTLKAARQCVEENAHQISRYANISLREFLDVVKQVLSLVVRIEPTTEQYQLLNDTAVAFARLLQLD